MICLAIFVVGDTARSGSRDAFRVTDAGEWREILAASNSQAEAPRTTDDGIFGNAESPPDFAHPFPGLIALANASIGYSGMLEGHHSHPFALATLSASKASPTTVSSPKYTNLLIAQPTQE